MDAAVVAKAILELRERGLSIALPEARFIVDWGQRAEVFTAENVVELAELARKHPTGGGVVLEMAWRLHGRAKGVEKA
ncbi:MAG: hypothetical protein AB1700_00660 [Bacillota bacterium]